MAYYNKHPMTFVDPDSYEEYERIAKRYLILNNDGEAVETYETLEEAKNHIMRRDPLSQPVYIMDLETRIYYDWNPRTRRWSTDDRPRG